MHLYTKIPTRLIPRRLFLPVSLTSDDRGCDQHSWLQLSSPILVLLLPILLVHVCLGDDFRGLRRMLPHEPLHRPRFLRPFEAFIEEHIPYCYVNDEEPGCL